MVNARNVLEADRCMLAKLLQFCLTLCNPMGHSLSGSSVHRILLARRILEWVTISSPQRIFLTQGMNLGLLISCIGRQVLYHQHYLGSPRNRRMNRHYQLVNKGKKIQVEKIQSREEMRNGIIYLGIPQDPASLQKNVRDNE